MILTAKINKLYINDKDKNGVPFLTKSGQNPGKPYKKISIKTDSPKIPQDKWLYGWIFKDDDIALQWKEGGQITVKVWENDGWWNFKHPTQIDYLQQDIDEANKRIKNLEDFVLNGEANKKEPEPKAEPEEDEELPF